MKVGLPHGVNLFRRGLKPFLRLRGEKKKIKMGVDHYCKPLQNNVIIAFIVVIIKHNCVVSLIAF